MSRPKRKYLPDYDAVLASGQVIGKYHIEKELAQTGAGSVYHVTERNQHYVLKLLAKDFAEVDGLASYLKLVGKRDYVPLHHENLMSLSRVGLLEGRIFLLRGYAEYGTLQNVLLQEGMLSVDRVRGLLQPIGAALSYIHHKGLLHQNIKPSNILLGSENQVYVTDLGMAPLIEAAAQTFLVDGIRISSPAYLAPEQLKLKEVTPQTDIYAFGALLFALLTGYPPYDASDSEELFQMQYSQAVPSARELNPSIPTEIDQALRIALGFARVSRFETVGELLNACGVGLPLAVPITATTVSQQDEAVDDDSPQVTQQTRWQATEKESVTELLAQEQTDLPDALDVDYTSPPGEATPSELYHLPDEVQAIGEELPAQAPSPAHLQEQVRPVMQQQYNWRKFAVLALSSLVMFLAVGISSTWAYSKWMGGEAQATRFVVAPTEAGVNNYPIALLTAGITLPPMPTDAAGVAITAVGVLVESTPIANDAQYTPSPDEIATDLIAQGEVDTNSDDNSGMPTEIPALPAEPSATPTITPTNEGDAVWATNVALGLITPQPTPTEAILFFNFDTPKPAISIPNATQPVANAITTSEIATDTATTRRSQPNATVTVVRSATQPTLPPTTIVQVAARPNAIAETTSNAPGNLVVVPTIAPVVVNSTDDNDQPFIVPATQPPVVVAPQPTQPPVVVAPQPIQPPVVVAPQPTQPPVVVAPQPTQPPVVVAPQPIQPPVVVAPQPTQPPVVVAPQPTQPPIVVAPQPIQPPVVVAPQPTQPPIVVAPEPTQPPVVVAPQPTNTPIVIFVQPTNVPIIIIQPTVVPPTAVPPTPLPQPTQPPVAAQGPREPFANVQSQIIQLSNQQRSCGNTLAHFNGLADAALTRSNDMANRNYFAHMDPATGNLIFPTLLSPEYNGMGENLFTAPSIVPAASVADVAMSAWMASAGHRSNLLNCSYRYTGIGITVDSSCASYDGGCWIITQLFSTDHP